MGFHDDIILHLKTHILGRKVNMGSYEKMPTICYVHSRKGQEGPEGRKRYSPTLSVTSALDGGGWSMPHTGCFAPGKETQSPLYRGLGGLQGWSRQVPKIMLLPGLSSL